MSANWPTLFQSLRAVHITYADMGGDEFAFFKAMSISVNAAATRTRPSVATWASNLRFRFKKDDDGVTQALDGFNASNKGSLVSQLTKKERFAVTTLVSWLPEGAVQFLLGYLRRVSPKKAVIGPLVRFLGFRFVGERCMLWLCAETYVTGLCFGLSC